MAIFYRDSSDTANNRAGLFVATTYCSTGANGQCIKDAGQELRVYTVVVSATDPAGRTATPAEWYVTMVSSWCVICVFHVGAGFASHSRIVC
jgi:hypothetical protein